MPSRYLEPRLERASRAEMTRVQTRRLREQIAHAAAHSPFYRRKLKTAGVKPAAIRTLADLPALPFTTKDELKEIACAGRRGIVTHAFGGIAGFARDCEHTTPW